MLSAVKPCEAGVPTSVVTTSTVALGLMDTSPVINPTSSNSIFNSLYFWLLRA